MNVKTSMFLSPKVKILVKRMLSGFSFWVGSHVHCHFPNFEFLSGGKANLDCKHVVTPLTMQFVAAICCFHVSKSTAISTLNQLIDAVCIAFLYACMSFVF